MRPLTAATAVFAFGLAVGVGGTAAADHIFSDVPDDHTHAPGIHAAAADGLVIGFPDGTFRPDVPVNRGQLATILDRQGAYTGPVYTLTPDCGSTTMEVAEHNGRGSGDATVEFAVDGGDRTELAAIPASGEPLEFDAGAGGVVTVFVDGIARVSTPTGEACTPAE